MITILMFQIFHDAKNLCIYYYFCVITFNAIGFVLPGLLPITGSMMAVGVCVSMMIVRDGLAPGNLFIFLPWLGVS